MPSVSDIIGLLKNLRFDLNNEKLFQSSIETVFLQNNISYHREYKLDKYNYIDFYIDTIGIEIKMNTISKMEVFRQCERYCKFENIKSLLLITNRSMGLPKKINNKPCYVLNVSSAWL